MLLILILKSLMVKKVQNLSSWLKKIYTFDYNLGPHAKIYSFYYNVSHVWSQYYYPVREITFKL